MSLWLRWVGVPLGILALLLFVWVHRSLGKSFSAELRIKERQTLVTTGPYRWIRHPIYIAFYVLHVAAFFLTANWFLGVPWIVGLTIIIVLRIKREEAMMTERFGEQYCRYMQNTGRFIPRVRLSVFAKKRIA